jgi:hypothetical protein
MPCSAFAREVPGLLPTEEHPPSKSQDLVPRLSPPLISRYFYTSGEPLWLNIRNGGAAMRPDTCQGALTAWKARIGIPRRLAIPRGDSGFLWAVPLGLGICCCCLIGYLRPAAPGSAA